MIATLAILAAEIELAPATPVSAIDFTWLFVKMLLFLGVICIAALIILKFLVPRMGFMKRLTRDGFAKVIARQVIEPRKHLYLVKIGEKYLVIGTADHGINLITELARGEVAGLGIKGMGD
jgi:flagellar biosynthetic protein FliO